MTGAIPPLQLTITRQFPVQEVYQGFEIGGGVSVDGWRRPGQRPTVEVYYAGEAVHIAAVDDPADILAAGRCFVDKARLGSTFTPDELIADIQAGNFAHSIHSGVCPVCEKRRFDSFRNLGELWRWSICRRCFFERYARHNQGRLAPLPDWNGQPIQEADVLIGANNTHTLIGIAVWSAPEVRGFSWLSQEERRWAIHQVWCDSPAHYRAPRQDLATWTALNGAYRLYYHNDEGRSVYRVIGRYGDDLATLLGRAYRTV